MDGWQFFASIVSSLAWPTVIIAVAVMFRDQLRELGTRLTTLRFRELQFDFGQTLTRVEQAVSLETAHRANALSEELPTASVSPSDRFERLADVSPASAVIEAWIDVEDMLLTMARHHGINLQRGRSARYLTRVTRSRGIIDERTAAILDDLRALRNAAAHGERAQAISKDDALRFRELSDEVIRILAASAD